MANAWLNEFHYDDAGADFGEFVEVAGVAGTDLAGWTIALYNGAGAVYGTIALSGTIPNLSNGFGTRSFPRGGLLDTTAGFALVDAGGAVVEFFSYEGVITATDGPALGMTSVDVGAAEPGTSTNHPSIARQGAGDEASDFATWVHASDDTPGAVNGGQSFGPPTQPPVAADDGGFYTVREAQLTISIAQLLANDSDPDGPHSNLSILSTMNLVGCTASVVDGNIVFTATRGFLGTASFDYLLSDGGNTDTGHVTVDVRPVISPWINEIDYRDSGAGTQGYIEIAGPAGYYVGSTQILLYDANGELIGQDSFFGFIPDQGNGWGTVSILYPAGELPAGVVGIALDLGEVGVVEFVSYGGVITAVEGEAAGMVSVDLGLVDGAGSGRSIGRTGAGNFGYDFTWADDVSSHGALNGGQSIGAPLPGGPPTLDLNGNAPGIDYADGFFLEDGNNAGLASLISITTPGGLIQSATITITDPRAGDLLTTNGIAQWITVTGRGTSTITLTGAGTGSEYAAALRDVVFYSTSDNPDFDGTDRARTITITIDDGAATATATTTMHVEPIQTPWINEIHYSNSGSDVGEFIEIAGEAGTDLGDWNLLLYDGATRRVYDVIHLSGVIPNLQNGLGTLSFAYAGLQNGNPDGIALTGPGGVVQFLSYGGAFTALGGAPNFFDGSADGMLSVNIGVAETDSTPAGHSLGLVGTGYMARDFTWGVLTDDTPGGVNGGQSFTLVPNELPIAGDDALLAEQDTIITYAAAELLGNDSDADDDALAITAVTNAVNGTAVLNPDGSVTFTPDPGFQGAAGFDYVVGDGRGSDTGHAAIDVGPAFNAPPTVVIDDPGPSFHATEQVTISVKNLIHISDSDSGNHSLTMTLTVDYGRMYLQPGPSGIVITNNDSASVTVTGTVAQINTLLAHASGFVIFYPDTDNPPAQATLTITVDDHGHTGSGAVTTGSDSIVIPIQAINDPTLLANPIPDQHSDEDAAFSYTVPANAFSDPDSILTYSAKLADNSPLPSWLTFTAATRTFSGTPPADFFGTLAVKVTAGGVSDTFNLIIDPVPETLNGVVVDGYIAGGTVFADADGNGVLDPGEAFDTTDGNGNFTLVDGSGPLVIYGGTDIATGQANLLTFRAPEGSTVVSPLTTLVQILIVNGSTPEDAQDAVAAAFGIDPGVDLTSFDPIANAGDPNALAVQQAAATVVVLVVEGAEEGGGDDGTQASLFLALAEYIETHPGAAIDLTDPLVVTAILEAVVGGAGIPAAAEQIADAAAAIDGATSIAEVSAAQAAGMPNDAPDATIAPASFSATEQVALDLKNMMSVADVDAGTGTITITLSVDYGIIHVAAGTSGATIDSGNDSASVVLSGTLDQINALLSSDAASAVTYTANTDTPPAGATLTLLVDDNGNTGDGGAQTGSASAPINITPVIDTLTVGNRVFLDANNNGVFDAGDSGIDGVTVWLRDSSNLLLATTSTSGGGLYQFTGLAAGDYKIQLDATTLSPALLSVPGGTDPDDDIDHDDNGAVLDPLGVSTTLFTLGEGGEPVNDGDTDPNTNFTVDFGFVTAPAPTVDLNGAGSGIDFAGAYTEGGAGAPIGDGIIVTATLPITSATINVTEAIAGDQLVVEGTLPASIIVSSGSGTTTLTLTGTGTAADWEAALSLVRYTSASDNPDAFGTDAARTITVVVSDAATSSAPATATIAITAVNDDPAVTGLSGDSVTFTEGDAHVLLDAGGNAGVADADSANFAGGSLSFGILTGATAQDLIFVSNTGAVSVSGSNVIVGGTTIGTISSQGAGLPLTIDLNANATPANLQQLVGAVAYTNLGGNDPTAGARSIAYILSDGDGGAAGGGVIVNVIAVNDEPTLSATAANPIHVENAAAADLFSGVTASTVEPGQTFTALTLGVSNVTDGASEILRIDGSDVALTNGNGVVTATNGLTVTVSLSGSTATVTFSGATLSAAQLEALVDALSYRNSSENPTDANRVVTILQLTDSGPGAAPDDNVATPNLASSVNVEPVNDAPTSTNLLNNTRAWTEGDGFVTLDVSPAATFADVDSPNFDGGSLTLAIGSPRTEDILGIVNTAIVTTSGNIVSVNGTAIGTFSGGAAGSALTFAFNADATPARIQELIRAIGYANSGGDIPTAGLRTVTWTFNDGDGNANGGNPVLALTSRVNVVPVNDPPISADVTVAIDEDQVYHFSTANFPYSDPEGNPPSGVRVETAPAHGILYFDPDGNGSIAAFEVSPGLTVGWSSIQAGNFYYVPAANQSGTAFDSFTFAVVDSGGAADTIPNTFTFDVATVNDAPVNTVPGPISISEDATNVAITGIQVADVEAGPAGEPMTVIFLVNFGTLHVDTGVPGGVGPGGVQENDVGTLLITGTQAQINTTLAAVGGLTYTPDANYNGIDTLNVVTSDLGFEGPGGARFDTDTIVINIAAVNDAPSGTDKLITINEDTPYILTVADFGFSDIEGHHFLAVVFSAAPVNGQLFFDGDGAGGNAPVALTYPSTVQVSDIALGRLSFVSGLNLNGTGGVSFVFQVVDDGGGVSPNVDTDPIANTIRFDVDAVNDAPSGTNGVRTMNEDGTFIFSASNFGFTDSADGNSFAGVRFAAAPTGGRIFFDADGAGGAAPVEVTAFPTATYSAADIAAGKLTFVPTLNLNGAGAASVQFQVVDNGGTAAGGIDTDPTPNTLTFDITSVNDAPSGADKSITINEDAPYTLTVADFGFSDVDGNGFEAVIFNTLTSGGTLLINGNPMTGVTLVYLHTIISGGVVFVPAANANGAVGTVRFTVRDDGGFDNGGSAFDPTPNLLSFTANPANDAPSGTDVARTINEDGSHTFAVADFGYSDPLEGNAFASVVIATLPANGVLQLSGNAVTQGQVVSAANISSGLLVFVPATNGNGSGYGNFTFQVRDNGGIANGGADTDPTANLFTLNVTAVNDAPVLDLNGAGAGTGSTGTYVENAVDFVIAPAATLVDPDSPDLGGGQLTVTITAGGISSDSLFVVHQGTGGGEIGVSGTTISYGGVAIGTASGTGPGSPLVIALNASATPAAVEALVRHIGFVNSSEFPFAQTRTVQFQLTDGDGGTSNTAVSSVSVTPLNDAPSGADRTFTIDEDGRQTFTLGSFGFSDGTEPNSFLGVLVTTLPTNGTLWVFGHEITHGDYFVHSSSIGVGDFFYLPDPGESGAPLDSFTFQVRDNGGTANGGQDTDQSPNTITINVNSVNDAPAFQNLDVVDPAFFVEGDVNPALLDTGTPATLTDSDNANFAGGTLTVSIFSGLVASQDVLGIALSGLLTGGGGAVSYDGVQFATYSGGSGGAPLVFSLDADANATNVSALVRAITYANTGGDDTTGGIRNILWTFVDGGGTAFGGHDTGLAQTFVNVSGINDEPTLAATALNPVFLEDGAAADLFSGVTASTIETSQTFISMTLTVTNVSNGSAESLRIDGSNVSLFDGNMVHTATNGLDVTVTVSGSTATVTFSDAALTPAQLQTLVDALTYRNTSQNPTDADRVVTITQIVDSSDFNLPDDNSGSPNLASTVNVNPVNDAPNLDLNGGGAGTGATLAYTENGPLTPIAPGAVASDNDNSTYTDGGLRVAITNGIDGQDLLAIINQGAGPGQIGYSGGEISYEGNVIGQVLPPALPGSTTILDIELIGANVSLAAVQALIRAIGYQNLSEDPSVTPRNVEFRLSEPSVPGALSTTSIATINVTAVDDAAVARADAVTTDEATLLNGNVLLANGSDADSDVDNPTMTVSAVNGSVANVGHQIVLASGALLTLNADGSFAYDPHGAFDATPAPGTGASNPSVPDSFTYTLAGGGTATVSVTVTGIDSDDTIRGTAGADSLAADGGTDQLVGLGGDDTYYVNSSDDLVVEAAGQGRDVVYASVGYALANGAHVEVLAAESIAATTAINLAGNGFNNEIYGNNGANMLFGGGGGDYLVGWGGDDTYFIQSGGEIIVEALNGGRDVVYTAISYALANGTHVEVLAADSIVATTAVNIAGNEFNNEIYGNNGANLLFGGGGGDYLVGWGGDDTYFIQSGGEIIVEALSGGRDVVYTAISYALVNGTFVEVLAADSIVATTAINLAGNSFNNEIYGNNGANILSGGGGGDYLVGWGGDDTYFIQSGGEIIVEALSGGRDVVYTAISYGLAAGTHVEVLAADSIAATTAIDLTGNELVNEVYGNNGANTLNGGAGGDYLAGFGGADSFAFTTALGSGNIDVIADFSVVDDTILLDNAVFAGLADGALPAGAFVTGAAAGDLDDRIVYNSATGQIFFDADGSGGGAQILFATVNAGTILTASDFQVI